MLKVIIISVLSIYVGVLLRRSPQHIIFNYKDNPVEISIWLILALVIVLITWYIWLLNIAYQNWLKNKTINQDLKRTKKALFALIAGDPVHAEQQALKINSKSNCSWLSLLIASKAAQEQNSWEKAYKYLLMTEIFTEQQATFWDFNFKHTNQIITFGIIKAEIFYNQQEYNKCLAELQKLYKKFPRNKLVLLKLAAIYQKLDKQIELTKLIPKLKKYNLLTQSLS